MTTNEHTYRAIQDFKNSPSAIVDGINYGTVIPTWMYDTSLAGLLKAFVFATFFAAKTTKLDNAGPVRIVYAHRYRSRPDYDYMIETVRSAFSDLAGMVEVVEKFSPAQAYRVLARLGVSLRATRGYRSGRLQRLKAAVLIAKYAQVAQMLRAEGIVDDCCCVITFCDAHPYDNLSAQLAKSAGRSTVTLQHGQYRYLTDTNRSADAEAYVNFISDRMLVWGPATVAELRKAGVDEARTLITGWIRKPVKRSETRVRLAARRFGVVLNGPNLEGSNSSLIEAAERLAADLDMAFVVRAHPKTNVRRYEAAVGPRCEGVALISQAEYVETVAFSVSHSSSVAIELLLAGSPVYLVDDGRLVDVFRKEGLSFDSYKDLLAAVKADLAGDEGLESADTLAAWYSASVDQRRRIVQSAGECLGVE